MKSTRQISMCFSEKISKTHNQLFKQDNMILFKAGINLLKCVHMCVCICSYVYAQEGIFSHSTNMYYALLCARHCSFLDSMETRQSSYSHGVYL